MKTRSSLLVAAVIALVWTGVSAQVAPTESPSGEKDSVYRFEISGDSIEELKIKFTPIHKVDQSTPEGVVKAYITYLNHDISETAEADDLELKLNRALANSMRREEQALLAANVQEDLKKDRERTRSTPESDEDDAEDAEDDESEMTYRYEQGKPEVTGTEKQEDGSVLVMVSQTNSISQQDWETGEWETREETEHQRFTCVEGEDGKWRISKFENRNRDWMSEDENAYTWEEGYTVMSFIYMMMAEKELPELPALKQDSPEAAARSVLDVLIEKHERLTNTAIIRIYSELVALVESMMTPEFIKALKEAGDDTWDDGDEDNKPLELESVTEGEDGARHVRFKPRSEWSSPIEIRVRKDGDVWKVIEVGQLEAEWDMEGNTTYNYRKADDIYSIRWLR